MRRPLGWEGEDDNRRSLCSEGCRRLNLVPQTVSKARVIISDMSTGETVMLEEGPGPLGLCPVRGVAKVNQDTTIWLANSGPGPMEVTPDQVGAMAERVSESERM